MILAIAHSQQLRGSFLGDVLKLSFGTLCGRLIALAVLPALTRLYSPQDFALLAVFLALVSTLAVAACLRLEIAIPLAKNDTEAFEVLILALIVLSTITLVVLIPSLLLPGTLARWLGAPEIARFLWLVPLGVALSGIYSVMQYWATRARRFGDIARTRITQAVSGVVTMLALGWVGLAPLGLLLGNMLNIGAGGVSLAASALRHHKGPLNTLTLHTLVETLRRHRKYPLFATPEALLNIAGVQVPVLIIAYHAGAEAGFLLLAMQVMTAPMKLMGSSISQVYLTHAPQKYCDGTLATFTLSIMRRLALVGVGPLILAGALSPSIFPLIFGADWARAGEIVTWLVPWMVLQFIASPVSMVMYVVGRQKAMLALTMLGVVMRVGGVLIALRATLDSLVAGFVLGSIAYYLAVMGFVMNAAGFALEQWVSLLKTFFDWRLLVPAALAFMILNIN